MLKSKSKTRYWTRTMRGFGAAAFLVPAGMAYSDVGVDASALLEAVTVDRVRQHLEAFQSFADKGDGTRESSSEAYVDSVLYISEQMTDAGYRVNVQVLPYVFFEDITEPIFEQISPESVTYTADSPDGFFTATYSGSGDVTAIAQPVDVVLPPGAAANTSTSGCEAEDFADFSPGSIALVQRGSCAFGLKATNAQNAGAAAVIIFNEGQEGRTDAVGATLGEAGYTIPVIGTAFAIGEALSSGEATVRVKVDALTESRITANVLADAPLGKADRTVVVGAHLDSVPDGPGINDNGSGSAAILETALQISALGYLEPGENALGNRLRFAWWGAEEAGLVGSEYYIDTLSAEALEDIALNLNFDMVGSPNYVRFVYDGDGSESDAPGPDGSAFIEWLFTDYFTQRGLLSEPTAFDGRSDYGPFIDVGIPAGGLFTGAEEIKTEEQVGIYGGTAGEAYDPCYHLACDDLDNLNLQGLDEMTDAIAYATYIMGKNELPASMAKAGPSRFEGMEFEYRGNRLQR